MDGGLLQWASLILGFVSPIVLLVITAKTDRRAKKEEFEREQAKSANQEERDWIKNQIQEIRNELKEQREHQDNTNLRMTEEISKLQKVIGDMQECDEDVKADLRVLSAYMKDNVQNVTELSRVVITLAEGMRDRHLDGNITAVVASYRAFQEKQLAQYMAPAVRAPERLIK